LSFSIVTSKSSSILLKIILLTVLGISVSLNISCHLGEDPKRKFDLSEFTTEGFGILLNDFANSFKEEFEVPVTSAYS
jgi:hypothetical protein